MILALIDKSAGARVLTIIWGCVMHESQVARELDRLTDQLGSMTSAVVGDARITPPDVRTVLRFVTKVVQVADQAFQDVYAVLIDIQFLQESDLATGHVVEVRRSLALLMARSRYRDAEEICSRLHHLAEEYSQKIDPIIVGVADRQAWSDIFFLLNEYEGRIIMMVEAAVYELEEMLGHLSSEPHEFDLSRVARVAGERAADIRSALVRLEALRNQILGLSGEPGLMALVSSSDREQAVASVIAREVRVGDTYHVQGAGAVGPHASASNVTINQSWQSLENHDTELLARELAVLRAELKVQSITAEHDLATGEVASAQLAAEKGDGPSAMAHLARVGKWALDVATSIGTTLASAAIKAAMGM
jgi:hypothetical protein